MIAYGHRCIRCNRTFFGKESLVKYSRQHRQHMSEPSTLGKQEKCCKCGLSSPHEFKPYWYLRPNDLHYAACTGNVQLVAKLMQNELSDQPDKSHRCCSKFQTGYTPMHCAAFGGHYDCLKLLLSQPQGKPNIADPVDGRTPVHLVCWKGYADCLKLLLSNGGNLHLRDHDGNTPIALARDYACLSIILLHLVGK